jgi:hypothetical protein
MCYLIGLDHESLTDGSTDSVESRTQSYYER